MTFPVMVPIGPWRIHPHVFFETLAYLVAFRVYLWQRRRAGDHLAHATRWSIVAAAAVGAAAGSKLLFWLENPLLTWAHRTDLAFLMGGKTLVGGLVGGLIAVELTKRVVGVRRSTGDLFAVPLALGIVIGRIGCFLTGLDDRTHGVATALPWGIDFGDGVLRHPTQIYEIVAIGLLGAWIARRRSGLAAVEGDAFKMLMVGYVGFRLAVDFLKPDLRWAGLSSIQWVCVATLAYYASDIRRWLTPGPTTP
jgi:prolipoprotein diacylglyceryltransferase